MGIFSRKPKGPPSTEGLSLGNTWVDQELDAAVAAVVAGDLETPLAMFKTQTTDPDRRAQWNGALAEAASGRSEWLEARLEQLPGDPDLLLWLAQTMVNEAWEVRTGAWARNVSDQQFATFHDILSTAHEVVSAAIEAAPDDSTPWTVLQWVAVGLGADRESHDHIFFSALERHPGSHTAHSNRAQVIAPKWYGRSMEELLDFGVETAAKAAPGQVLGTVLTDAVIEAWLAVLSDSTASRSQQIADVIRLKDRWTDPLVETARKWLQAGRAPEAADLGAHNAYAFFFKNRRQELGRFHAEQTLGRVSQIPWAYLGDPLEEFAVAYPGTWRT